MEKYLIQPKFQKSNFITCFKKNPEHFNTFLSITKLCNTDTLKIIQNLNRSKALAHDVETQYYNHQNSLIKIEGEEENEERKDGKIQKKGNIVRSQA